jgi:hypothetical protein
MAGDFFERDGGPWSLRGRAISTRELWWYVHNHAARRLRAEFRQREVAIYVKQLELDGWQTTSAVEAIVANTELKVSARYVYAAMKKHRVWVEARCRLQQRGIKQLRKLPKQLRKNAR